jgi:hypothetical protein
MPQDAAGKPLLSAAVAFVAVVVSTGIAFRYRRDLPGGPWVWGVGAALAGLGVVFLLYLGFLAIRSNSAKGTADYEAYQRSVRDADAGWRPTSPTANVPPDKANP